MDNEVKTWLADIQQAIAEIKSFLPEKKMFAEFQKDLKTKRAIEWNIAMIGEAMSRILKQHPEITITMREKLWTRETELRMVTILFRMILFGRL